MGEIMLIRPGGEAFKFLDFGIYVDNKKINFISDDTRKFIKLEAGHHEIYVKVVGAKSNVLNININKKEKVNLICKMRFSGFKSIFSGLYLFSRKLLILDHIQ